MRIDKGVGLGKRLGFFLYLCLFLSPREVGMWEVRGAEDNNNKVITEEKVLEIATLKEKKTE